MTSCRRSSLAPKMPRRHPPYQAQTRARDDGADAGPQHEADAAGDGGGENTVPALRLLVVVEGGQAVAERFRRNLPQALVAEGRFDPFPGAVLAILPSRWRSGIRSPGGLGPLAAGTAGADGMSRISRRTMSTPAAPSPGRPAAQGFAVGHGPPHGLLLVAPAAAQPFDGTHEAGDDLPCHFRVLLFEAAGKNEEIGALAAKHHPMAHRLASATGAPVPRRKRPRCAFVRGLQAFRRPHGDQLDVPFAQTGRSEAPEQGVMGARPSTQPMRLP